MIGKRHGGQITGLLYAGVFAPLIAAMVHGRWPRLPIVLIVIIFVALIIGFYFVGIWVAIDRPAELDKKFPISSKELRRRKKALFEWLDSQGRHSSK